jgi:hydrogenase maturation protein HypF
MEKTFRINISGQVQGVGFRPYVFSLANKYLLKGTVSNNEQGVIINVTGSDSTINNFYKKLVKFPPPVAKIKSSFINQIEYIPFKDFTIVPSKKEGAIQLMLTPDFAICNDCKKEIIDKENRRFNYPFTTCVNCGPRWAITESFPFERNHTSIDDFPMCEDCKNEYTNPIDRRFHSQTNTCPVCGIQLFLTDNKGDKIQIQSSKIFLKAAKLLEEGNILAIKNTSGFLLCCNAENHELVNTLRRKKNRPKKPFAVLYPSIEFLKNELTLTNQQLKSLESTERPINIISLHNYSGKIALNEVAPGLNHLGVMVPYSGLLQLLTNHIKFPIVATSGNIHGSPIISDNNGALEKLKNVADYFLYHNLRIVHPQDDSVVKFSDKFKREVLFRRSRGYAPNLFEANINTDKKIMALGAHLKSSVAFIPNEYLYVSEYIGNLDSFEVYNRFTKITENFIDIFEQEPEILLVDTHPGYQSSIYGFELAKKLQIDIHKIQHHKAHFASVLGEHNLFNIKEPILGVIWDGTGYGDDSNIWGGEFFKYDSNNIDRISHFEYFDWFAGDKMSKEPKLSLFSLTNDSMQSVLEDKFTSKELAIYKSLKKKNKLKTSSVGRLFDAVASLLGVCDINTYEGEAAILLENLIGSYNLSACKLYCKLRDDGKVPTHQLFQNIFNDYQGGISNHEIVINFFFTLATMILDMATKYEMKMISCSGGVFQNTTLIDMLIELGQNDFKLYFNNDLAPNDENISFGQVMYYLQCMNK